MDGASINCGCQKNVSVFKIFFYNHLHRNSVIRDLIDRKRYHTIIINLYPITAEKSKKTILSQMDGV
jgi:hypothetical protein